MELFKLKCGTGSTTKAAKVTLIYMKEI